MITSVTIITMSKTSYFSFASLGILDDRHLLIPLVCGEASGGTMKLIGYSQVTIIWWLHYEGGGRGNRGVTMTVDLWRVPKLRQNEVTWLLFTRQHSRRLHSRVPDSHQIISYWNRLIHVRMQRSWWFLSVVTEWRSP